MLPLVLGCLIIITFFFFFQSLPLFASCWAATIPVPYLCPGKVGYVVPFGYWQTSVSPLNHDQCHQNTLHLWYAQYSLSNCLGAHAMWYRMEHNFQYGVELTCWSSDISFSSHMYIALQHVNMLDCCSSKLTDFIDFPSNVNTKIFVGKLRVAKTLKPCTT